MPASRHSFFAGRWPRFSAPASDTYPLYRDLHSKRLGREVGRDGKNRLKLTLRCTGTQSQSGATSCEPIGRRFEGSSSRCAGGPVLGGPLGYSVVIPGQKFAWVKRKLVEDRLLISANPSLASSSFVDILAIAASHLVVQDERYRSRKAAAIPMASDAALRSERRLNQAARRRRL